MINLIIHGHFYQPPRENAWSGEIELQRSAAPYHDWNERILHECYMPNSKAQIINDIGKIIDRVNNYEYLSFNFGPTLLHWIKTKHHDTYKKIIHADNISAKNNSGHGNAIAMCYNHMIMPLANYRDKITQIRWGLKDFEYHFKREPEGIWLPETACNMETIEALIDEGVKFIILDTGQAEKVKSPTGEWIDVSNGSINPKIPYKCYSELHPDRFITIFFYDGPISKAVAFDDVLKSSQNLLNKITQAIDLAVKGEFVIDLATDGETFGHHKKFADRTLAYFIKSLVPENNINITNFGSFLANNPAVYEVQIKRGDNNEGTSWSCPHGVKRWKEDCGCGGGGDWNQQWRKPLRDAMNWLRDELIAVFEKYGQNYFKDPWAARNSYIDLLLDNSSKNRRKFFSEHSTHKLGRDEKKIAYNLLEMQKFAMFMFTSCGWFFSEISGLEAVQILQYAAKAIEIGEYISGKGLENQFLEILSMARPNDKTYKTGADIWQKLVLPAKQTNQQSFEQK